jgi:nucleotide-binding universal stress UspA family protein
MSEQVRTHHHGGTIVVGVDTSKPSLSALVWAAREAEMTGSQVRAVTCWDLPAVSYWSVIPESIDFEGDARSALSQAVRETLGEEPPVKVTEVVRQGRAAQVLITESETADLLVVGSRGHGEFTGMLIGSVSEHCVAHAHCPVVVVRS